jgi:rhodanese-related sulfurtransferase
VGVVAAVYPAVWGLGQLAAGAASDHVGRKPLIASGMFVQAAALALLVAGQGAFVPALGAAILLGVGTALVYPTLIAAVSDVAQPVDRAQLVGVYRFWRDFGFVIGALLAGSVADAYGTGAAIVVVAALTAGSGIWVATTRFGSRPEPLRRTAAELLADAQKRIAPRLDPNEAFRAMHAGAVIIDLRSNDERRREGIIPGAVHIPRSVLEWRLDPDSGYSNPHVTLGQQVIVFCAHGFSSSFAAVTLRELGWRKSTDIVGGYEGWKAAGLPTTVAREEEASLLPGMGPPDPLSDDELNAMRSERM